MKEILRPIQQKLAPLLSKGVERFDGLVEGLVSIPYYPVVHKIDCSIETEGNYKTLNFPIIDIQDSRTLMVVPDIPPVCCLDCGATGYRHFRDIKTDEGKVRVERIYREKPAQGGDLT